MINKFIIGAIFILGAGVFIYNIAVGVFMDRWAENQPIDINTGIIKGAEDIYAEGNNGKAILMLHGFIGSPTDYGDLPSRLIDEGYTVYVPLYPGHGRHPRTFDDVTADDLKQFTTEAYLKLKAKHDEVSVVGFSMGGALAIILANQRDVDKLVLLSPQLKVKYSWYFILPSKVYHTLLSPLIPYIYRLQYFKQLNDRSAMDKMIDYDYLSMKGTKAAFVLGKEAERLAPNLKEPTLMIHSINDGATDYMATKELAKKLGPQMVKYIELQHSNHIICQDFDKEQVMNEVVNFFRSAK